MFNELRLQAALKIREGLAVPALYTPVNATSGRTISAIFHEARKDSDKLSQQVDTVTLFNEDNVTGAPGDALTNTATGARFVLDNEKSRTLAYTIWSLKKARPL